MRGLVLICTALAALSAGARAQEGEEGEPAHLQPVKHARSRLFEAHSLAKELKDIPIEQGSEAVTREREIRRLLGEALVKHGQTTVAIRKEIREEAERSHVEAPAPGVVNVEYKNATHGAWSIAEILARLDDEGAMALGEEAEVLEEKLLEVRTKLATTISNATMAAMKAEKGAEAEAEAAEEEATDAAAAKGKETQRLDDSFLGTSEAYRLLKRAVELRKQIEALREQIEDAVEREEEALKAEPYEDCVANLLDSAAAKEEVHKDLEVRQEYMCRAMVVHQMEARNLTHVTEAERRNAADGVCGGVRRIYSLKRHPDAAQRSCRRMRVVLGEVEQLDKYRAYLASYRCDPEAPRNATCSGNGVCGPKGHCFCKPGFTAADCSITTCPGGCSGNGFCNRGKCRCDDGWSGDNCEIRDCPRNKGVKCSGRGVCERNNATKAYNCMCEPGFQGLACEQPVCAFGDEFPYECSARGTCGKDGKCKCFRGFGGETCERRVVKHGYCNAQGGCVCDKGWNGAACDLLECPLMCSGDNGVCDGFTGKCLCKRGWRGSGCQYVEPLCPRTPEEKAQDRAANASGLARRLPARKQCSARGLCKPKVEGDTEGDCLCPPGYVGDACQFKDCPNDRCFDERHGVCLAPEGKDRKCACFSGFSGPGCAQHVKVPVPCGEECYSECLHAQGCSVSRTGGKHNNNRNVYPSGDRTSRDQSALDKILGLQLPAAAALANPNSGKLTDCFLACSQQCVSERCWERGAEWEHMNKVVA